VIATGSTQVRSPVVEALAEAQSSHPLLDLTALHTLVDARERDLAYPSFATLADLAAFAADTQGPPLRAHASALLAGEAPSALADAAHFAGEAIGLAVLLRGVPAHAASRLSYAPADVARERGASPARLLSGGGAAAAVYGAVAQRARRALSLAEDAVVGLPRGVRPAFWGLSLPRIYLRRLAAVGNDPFDEKLQQGMRQTYPLRLQLSLLRRRVFRQ
jgi:phytoene/squalene synthetase